MIFKSFLYLIVKLIILQKQLCILLHQCYYTYLKFNSLLIVLAQLKVIIILIIYQLGINTISY